MGEIANVVEKNFQLTVDRADRLRQLAQAHELNENEVVEKALDILFTLTDIFDHPPERQGWTTISEAALSRVWDNPEDAVYDDWTKLYDVSAG